VPRPEISSIAPWPSGHIARVLSPCERPVPLLGAGVSAGCGMPTGPELARWIRALPLAAGVDFSSLPARQRDNPLWVSQLIVDNDREVRAPLHQRVAAHIASREADVNPNAALLALAHTPNRPSLILTLNYDLLVERAAEIAGRECETLGVQDIQQLLNDGLVEPSEKLRVLHLHGSLLDPPEELVFDAGGYSQRANDSSVAMLFGAVLPYYNLCILGCSFEEQYLATVMSARRPNNPRHVIVGDAALADRIYDGESELSTALHNILVCDYPEGEHAVLDGFCRRLVHCAPPPDTGPRVGRLSHPGDPLYEPRRLVDATDRGRSDFEISLALGQLEPLGESDLQTEPRAIVIGSPGAGKSRLLERLAETPAAGERAVLVRLRDVHDVVGTPEALFDAWLAAGSVIDGGEPISIAAIGAGEVRAHVLLDGLDELPREQRALVAEATKRIGEAFPDQRFTLSSRPSGELELLPPDWRRLELLCDQTWRVGLLGRLGSDEGRLADRLGPLYARIEPLLRVPFFLRGLHELLEQDRVPRDGLDLALALLRRLTEQDPQLRTIGPRLESWLRQAALTTLLSGSSTLRIEQLRMLARDLGLGDPDRVVDLLASRSLLLDAAGEYTFQHRLFAEALVADFLLEEAPETWIDVLVPEVAGRAALREDWRGVADLLLPRSDTWRTAVAERDPTAVARCTPADASFEERRWAARQLWRRAQELEIWIDPVNPVSARSDGEIVGSLMREGDLPEMEAEVRAALDSDSRFRRGNAVDVMAEAEVPGLEEILKEVLLEDPDTVVRRSAAIAAERRDLQGLQDVLQQRAQEATDEAEAQTLASAALFLSPPAERVERAKELLLGGNDEIDDAVVVDELPAAARLEWMSTRVRGGSAEHWWPRQHLDEVIEELGSPTAEEVAQVGLVAAAAGSTSAVTCAFLEEHRGAAAGLIEAMDLGLAESYQIADLLLAAGEDSLRHFGADAEVVEEARRRGSGSTASARGGTPGRSGGSAASAEPGLAQILELANDETKVALLAINASRIAVEVRASEDEAVQHLAELLDRVWGEADLRDAVEVDGSQATVQRWAGAVLELGPACGLSLGHDRWLQVALCDWLFTPQISWLREAAEPGWLLEALDETDSERSLGHLAQAATRDDELEALVTKLLGTGLAELSPLSREKVIERLREARRPDLLRRLSGSDEDFARSALPHLARSGDVDAQRAQLEELIEALRAGTAVEAHEILWLSAVTSPSLSELLAEAVLLAGAQEESGRLRPNRTLGYLQAAAERAEPIAALDLYDRLIAEKPWPGAQFTVENRQALLQRLLAEAATASTAAAAARLRLPLTDG